MDKAGATVMNYVLMIGLMVVALIIISNLQSFVAWQSGAAEKDMADLFLDQIKTTIEKAISYPSDSQYLIVVPFAEEYQLNVTNNLLSLAFTQKEVSAQKVFFHPKINLLASSIENAGKIRVYYHERNLLVTNRLNCDILDNECDPGCAIMGRCDPVCYESGNQNCNPYCVDVNHDGKTNSSDIDSKCDIDCTKEDGICDPDCGEYERDDCNV